MLVFLFVLEFIMNYFVSTDYAYTADGEWVTPQSVQQVDFDLLRCMNCKLKIGVQIDLLTGTRTFTHLLGHINNVARLKTCRFNKLRTVPEQTSPKTIPPPENRLRPANTTIRQWRCCWCDTCWHGDKRCPKCYDSIYVTDA